MTDTEAAAIRAMAAAHERAGYIYGLLLALLAQIDTLPPLATPDEIRAVKEAAERLRPLAMKERL